MRCIHRAALLAALIAVPAVADVYTITGKQTEFGFNPAPPVKPKVTNTPAEPSFHGTWQIDTGASLSGDITFDAYHAVIKAMLFKAEVRHAGTVYRIDGGQLAYDAASRTLTLGDARLDYAGATAPLCTGSSMICSRQSDPDMERFELKLTFADPGLNQFSGTAIATNEGGENGNAIHTWTFSGARATPPAAPQP
jgi:hypothetical protein